MSDLHDAAKAYLKLRDSSGWSNGDHDRALEALAAALAADVAKPKSKKVK